MILGRWPLFVSRRFSRVDRGSRSLATSFLSTLGICFGVMTLIVTLSVMNGFQRLYIDAIMEISSFHLRLTFPGNFGRADQDLLEDFKKQEKNTLAAVVPFREAQTLMVGVSKTPGRRLREGQEAALVRAVPPNICDMDSGFERELEIRRGAFDLFSPGTIVLGNALAANLGVTVGDQVNLAALSGGVDVDLLSASRLFTVTGIFRCGYPEISAGYCFIPLEDGEKYFGESSPLMYGFKLKNPDQAYRVMENLKERLSADSRYAGGVWESWQSYNRSFFGALRVEKNILMLFVFIIFVVVGVNIYNGMKRMVFERQSEIAVFAALGGRKRDIQMVFVMRGFLNGFQGALAGLLLGVLLCVQMDRVFLVVASGSYYVQYFFTALFDTSSLWYLRENPMYGVYASIPARMYPGEILFTVFFGIFSALAASWAASLAAVNNKISEVLHEE